MNELYEQESLFDFNYQPSNNISNYKISLIDCGTAKQYIIKNHYSHGCSNAPKPCYGLFDNDKLIGVLMFATPCSEAVRASVFGKDYKDWVIELHRLHILDCTPKNTESWFISRCLKLLKQYNPEIRAIISFADSTQGHQGTIYKATHFFYCGKTGKATFYLDETGRLRHPHQCGKNITKEIAQSYGWKPIKRSSKYRYIYIYRKPKTEFKKLVKMCKYELKEDYYKIEERKL